MFWEVKMGEMAKSFGSGFVGGLLGSLCCVTPLVLVLLGLSGLSGAMALAGTLQQNFRWTLFIPIGLVFLLASIYFHIKKREGTCNVKLIKHYKAYVIGTIVFAIIVWFSLIYVIVPAIFGMLS
jgi:hypothetical protein